MRGTIASLGDLVDDPGVRLLLRHWGEPYHWGRGDPSTLLSDHARWDCSGFAQASLVALGILNVSEPDRTAFQLAMISDPLEEGQEKLGDLAYYGDPVSHVMVVLAPGIVLGACGGSSKTYGENPRAYVKLNRTRYRKDRLILGRIKNKYRRK